MKIVLVTWHDAYSKDEWHSENELTALLKDQPKGQVTVTPALLYDESADAVTLIQSLAPETAQTAASFSGVLVIPKAMVVSIEVWKEIEI